MAVNQQFWAGKKVLITGHTGFKGSWLAIWLEQLGAQVFGCSLSPESDQSLFAAAGVESFVDSTILDIRDAAALKELLGSIQPEIVLHLAAQSLVIRSYEDPQETYQTNVLGTLNVLEAIRATPSVRAIVVVTTDKVYQNNEWDWPYRELDKLGGHDPYSSSKACAELLSASYRDSFFSEVDSPNLATARAGNVIGGGDWSENRLVPDVMQMLLANAKTIEIRNPQSVRPWQHVLESLAGYLLLAERLCSESGKQFCQAWNFGPNESDIRPVESVVSGLIALAGADVDWQRNNPLNLHEAKLLKVDSSRAKNILGWQPHWSFDTTLKKVFDWYQAEADGGDSASLCRDQINAYTRTN